MAKKTTQDEMLDILTRYAKYAPSNPKHKSAMTRLVNKGLVNRGGDGTFTLSDSGKEFIELRKKK